MTIYAIRNKKNPELLLRISIFSNGDAEFCNECGDQFETSERSENVYVVTTRKEAEQSLKEDPHWFNASLTNPAWPSNFDPKEWEVFEVNV